MKLGPGEAEVALETVPEMLADDQGLVHGGFIFCLADYAAMLAINQANVVLGQVEMRFLRPVRVGETVLAKAVLAGREGKKMRVEVTVLRGEEEVAAGQLTCFVPGRHVLAKN